MCRELPLHVCTKLRGLLCRKVSQYLVGRTKVSWSFSSDNFINHLETVYYRPQRCWGKVMFLLVSVILFTPANGFCCRCYASYWNAFLFKFHFQLFGIIRSLKLPYISWLKKIKILPNRGQSNSAWKKKTNSIQHHPVHSFEVTFIHFRFVTGFGGSGFFLPLFVLGASSILSTGKHRILWNYSILRTNHLWYITNL